jgi:hypothetical protein
MSHWFAAGVLVLGCAAGVPAAELGGTGLRPGETIDYHDLAFFPGRWEERKLSPRLFPWEGDRVVLLTTK